MKKKAPPKKVILYQKYLQETTPVEEPEPVIEKMEYPGMQKETIVIYKHGDFYEFLRKLGCLLLFLLVLILVAFAIIAIALTIFEEGMIPDGILRQIIL